MKSRFALNEKYLEQFPGLSERLPDYGAADAAEVRRKARGSVPEIAEGERATIQVISTQDVDRDGEMLISKGAVVDEYMRNPVVLWAHDYTMPPIARTTDVAVKDGRVTAKAIYSETPFANDIYTLKREGIQTAVSVGFVPIEFALNGGPGWKATTRALSDDYGISPRVFNSVNAIHTKWLLLEYSDVPIPSNPAAVTMMKALSLAPETIERLGLADAPEPEPEGVARVMACRAVTARRLPKVRRPTVKVFHIPSAEEVARRDILRRQGRL